MALLRRVSPPELDEAVRRSIRSLELPARAGHDLEEAVASLSAALHENLSALVVYGSAVRGDFVPGESDIDLLVALERSTPEAHEAIGRAIEALPTIDPFVVERAGLPRKARVFGLKFLSIRRHSRVLLGSDPLAGIEVDPATIALLVEQELRNLRLRAIRAFVVSRRDPKSYFAFLARSANSMVVTFSDELRRSGVEPPDRHSDRAPLMTKTFGADASVLDLLLDLRARAGRGALPDALEIHSRLLALFDAALARTEPR